MHRFRLLLLFSLLTSAVPARAAEPAASDDFLKGYVAAVLERELGWAPGSFQVQVRNRVATVVINVDDPQKRELIEQTLSRIGGLEQIHVVVSSAAPSAENEPIVFPAGDLFRPLLADPRQPQFFVSFVKMTTPTDRITAASVGYGENFGLWRWPGANPGDGWQFNFAGGLFALFNLSAPSNDLVNGDYNVGFSLTHGAGPWSQRFRLYHQSSHLGDEFLLSQPNIKRINLSIEAVDAVTSYEGKRWRVYGGPGYLIGRDPPDLYRRAPNTVASAFNGTSAVSWPASISRAIKNSTGTSRAASRRAWSSGRPIPAAGGCACSRSITQARHRSGSFSRAIFITRGWGFILGFDGPPFGRLSM